jgi:hypothetical protein
MAGYTIKNLKDADDSAASSSDVEARFARKHLDSRELGVSYVRYAPGYRSKMGHSHREQEEAYVVIAGAGRVKLDDEIPELRQWEVLRVSTMRRGCPLIRPTRHGVGLGSCALRKHDVDTGHGQMLRTHAHS